MEAKQQEETTATKRPSAELFSHDDQSLPAAVQKKIKVENFSADNSRSAQTQLEPSKVLHVRNLPPDTTNEELVAIARPFGEVETVVILRNSHQAFVQMESKEAAQSLLNYYFTVPANVRSKTVFFQFSTRSEVSSSNEEKTNCILLATVVNVVYPVTVEALHTVFSKYGNVLKIIIFHKNGFQALVQYSSVEEANSAKQALDGQNIYAGCCTLKIQYSAMTNLNVKYNNDKSRDYTNPSLPAFPAVPQSQRGILPTASPPAMYDAAWNPYMAGFYPFPRQSNSLVIIVSNLEPKRVTIETLFTLFGVYGDVARIKIMFNKPDTALVQYSNQLQCQMALDYLNGCPLYGKSLVINFSKHSIISMPNTSLDEESTRWSRDFAGSSLHRYKGVHAKNLAQVCAPSPVLHVSNLSPSVTDNDLHNLFSRYGQVVFIKQFSNGNRRNAFVQMNSVAEAIEALINTHNYRLEDESQSCIRVSFSKNKVINS